VKAVAKALIVVLLAPVAAAHAGSAAAPSKLTIPQMKMLVREYMGHSGGKYGLVVEDEGEETHFAGFRYFDVLTRDPNAFFASLDHVAVDEATGDLWFANACGADESARLSIAQRKLRARIGLSDTEYRRLRRSGPYCDGTPYLP
jgi:hypothetical protein